MKNQNLTIPNNVSRVTETLKNAGFQAFLVGGCVRDLVMDKQPKDWDIATNAHPEQIIALFPEPQFRSVYENTFGTVTVIIDEEPIEITTYRREAHYSDHRHPDSVVFAETLEEDLQRRDFTMNALALDLYSLNQKDIKKDITDIYGGISDIDKKTIKCVGDAKERFTEDALRIMRGIRFAAQLGFTVSHETIDAMFHVKHLLNNIAIERIRDEFIKIIDSPNPSIGIGIMKQLGILEIILPELLEGDGCIQGGVHKYDVFEHLVHACQHAADKNYTFHVKLAALFHDIGKPRTRRPGTKKAYTFYGHEVIGARMVEKIMKRMKFPKADTDLVVKLVRWHMFFSDPEQISLSAVRRLIQNVGKEHIWTLMQVRECDRVGMNKTEAPYRLRKYFAMIEECLRDPISVSQLKIDGNDLKNTFHVKPGPRMGWMLHALLEEVLEDPSKNSVETLSARVQELEQLSDAALKKLGEQGKEKKEEAEAEEVGKLHVKHGVK